MDKLIYLYNNFLNGAREDYLFSRVEQLLLISQTNGKNNPQDAKKWKKLYMFVLYFSLLTYNPDDLYLISATFLFL